MNILTQTPSTNHYKHLALKGDILIQSEQPNAELDTSSSRIAQDAWLLISDGAIDAILEHGEPPNHYARIDHSGHLICPGFVDAHVHYPQATVMASYGAQLLDWLNQYTFPTEAQFSDPAHCNAAAQFFVQQLMAHGTTCAAVFPTVHACSVDAWFKAAQAVNMASICGKIFMDTHAPDTLRDDVIQAEKDSVQLIERWHGKTRARYAITPRFAPTSTREQLQMAARLYQAYPGLYMQTHVAENMDEVRWVQSLFPEARSYLDVYDRYGLLRANGIFAHGIWLDATDLQSLSRAQAAVAFCPTSNLFLGSGLFNLESLQDANVPIALASDVGGGTTLSMLRTLHAAYTVMALKGQKLNAWQGFYMATLGGAKALGLDHELGSLSAGKQADCVVLSWYNHDLARKRYECSQTWHERLFALMMLGDERNTVATYVQGQCQYKRTEADSTDFRLIN